MGSVGWLVPVHEAERGQQRVAPGWRGLMALGWGVLEAGLTQAVVRLEHPAQRLSSCGCCSDMFYGLVSSYCWSCPAPVLPE